MSDSLFSVTPEQVVEAASHEGPPDTPGPEAELLHLDTTYREYLAMHPSSVYAQHMATRIGRFLATGKQEIKDSDNKWLDGGLAASTVATQAADRFRVFLLYVPTLAVEAFRETEVEAVAGLVAGLGFIAWSGAVGEVLTQSSARFPKTADSFRENFPVTVDLFTDALPGIEIKKPTGAVAEESDADEPRNGDEFESETLEDSSKSRAKRMLGAAKTAGDTILTNLRRSFVGMSIGSTAYVATSYINGSDKSEMRRENVKTTLLGGGLVFAIGYGVAKRITQLEARGDYESALNLYNWVSNEANWYKVAAASVGYELISNHFRKKKFVKEASSANIA